MQVNTTNILIHILITYRIPNPNHILNTAPLKYPNPNAEPSYFISSPHQPESRFIINHPTRPEGPRRCPGRGNAGGLFVFFATFFTTYVQIL